MFVGALEIDVLLGDVHTLKQKRSVIRPMLADLQRYGVCAAEGGHQQLYRRALVGVALVSSEMGHLSDVLDRCERHVAARPELQLLSVRRRIFGPED